jgi:hypothetical protein
MEDDFASSYDLTHSTDDYGWQGVQEMNMRMGHAQVCFRFWSVYSVPCNDTI